jgi:hypothetical protein
MARVTDCEAIMDRAYGTYRIYEPYLNIYDNFFSDITFVGDRSVDKDKDSAIGGFDVKKRFAVVVGKLAVGDFKFGAS